MKIFENKTALVTGATSGLGSEIVKVLAIKGAQVIVHYNTNKEKAEKLVKELNSSESFAISEDFSEGDLDEVCGKFISNIVNKTKKIDFLINNAADQSLDPDEIVDDVIINKIMLTNVLAPQALVKACLPYFPKDSAIVNITSVESEFPFPNHSLYASSKAALKRYSELAAIELAEKNIRCNAVSPGLIYREDLYQTWPDGLKKWNEKAPIKRPVSAIEVANTVSFLLSQESSGITGTTITVDGGWSVA